MIDYSLFFAKLLGPLLVIIGAGVLANLKYYQDMMVEFAENKAMLYLGGFLALIFGLFIVLLHNKWAANWTVIITLFGWAGLIKGIFLIAFPRTMIKLTEGYKDKTSLMAAHLSIVIILGAILVYMGYFSTATKIGF